MITNRICLLFFPALLSTFSIYSQEIFTLNRCITTGLEGNFSIQIAKNREEIASNNYTPGNAGMLPVVDASSNYGGTVNNTRQEFTTGRDTSINGVHNNSAGMRVNLDWTLFQGFNALTSYKKLSELKQVGELNTQLAIEDFMADMASEFYFYIQQIRLNNNLAYAVSLSRERVRIDRERYLLGASSKLQLLQSQVDLNSDSSRHAKQKEVLYASQVRINRLMAMDDLGQRIAPEDSNIMIYTGLNYDTLLASMLQLNTSLLIARKNQVISQYDYKIIASRTYPYLNFNSGYNYNYNKFEKSSLRSQQADGLNYGLSLGINLFDGFNQRRQKANARIEIENRDYEYRQVDQMVKADLITIFYAYQNNLVLFELEQENLKTAGENLEIALERYKLGSLTGFELREVQKSLLEAEERLLQVQFQTKLAEISLLQIAGKIMTYLG